MRTLLPFALALAAACGDDGKLEDTLYELDCDVSDTNPAWTEDAADAPTPMERATPLVGTWSLPGDWVAAGTETTVDLTLAVDETRAPTLHLVTGGVDAEACTSTLTLPVTISITTADGGLDLDLAGAFILDPDAADETGELRVVFEDPGAGTWDPADELGENDELVGLELAITNGPDGLTGTLYRQIEGEDGETAWSGIEEALTFAE